MERKEWKLCYYRDFRIIDVLDISILFEYIEWEDQSQYLTYIINCYFNYFNS